MKQQTKKTMIITFKPKEQRANKDKDKLEVVSAACKTPIRFFTADDMARGPAVPSGMPDELVGYDVNRYEAPIVMARLTDREIDALKKDGNVAEVEDDGECYALGERGPFGLQVEDQPHVAAETIPAGVNQIKAPAAWDCTRGKAIKVAVLDTGIDYDHPDLKPNYKYGVSFVPDESSPKDYNGHGTHCAGTIAATINGAGVVGVAPAAYLYAVKVLNRAGSGQWSWMIAGLDWCINKKRMHVASMSLGGTEAPNALKAMCDATFKKGVLLVAAAGNAGPDDNTVGVPARYESVIAVSAIDKANQTPEFSSRGPEVELCAPGVDVLSTTPGGGYRKLSGSSMACPHVSGAAALAFGSHRYADNVIIRRLLAWRSDNLGVPGRDALFGYGRVDAEQVACELTTPPEIDGIA